MLFLYLLGILLFLSVFNNMETPATPIKRKRAPRDPNAKPKPRTQTMTDVRIATTVGPVEYGGMCKDLYEYFKDLHNNKNVLSAKINALVLKSQLITWKLTQDYQNAILFEKQVINCDSSSSSDIEIKKEEIESDFLNDF